MTRPSPRREEARRRRAARENYEIARRLAPRIELAFALMAKRTARAVDAERVAALARRRDARGIQALVDAAMSESAFAFASVVESVLERVIAQQVEDEVARLRTAKARASTGGTRIPKAAVEWLRKRSASLVRDVTREQRDAVRQTLSRNLKQNLRPERVAASIARTVGLTRTQAEWVEKRRERLDEAGWDPDTVDERCREFADGLRASRGEAIARTETNEAQSEALDVAWDAAVDQGALDRDEVMEEWVSADDSERTSDICRELNGQRVPLGEPFYSEVLGSAVDRPPAHPNCRSTRVLVFRSGRSA